METGIETEMDEAGRGTEAEPWIGGKSWCVIWNRSSDGFWDEVSE